MYYLEDKHPVYEYTLYTQIRMGTPFIGIWHGSSMQDIYQEIGEIEHKHNKYRQPFYIDNDFYNNHYTEIQSCYYYKFMYRKVNDWHELTEHKRILKKVT